MDASFVAIGVGIGMGLAVLGVGLGLGLTSYAGLTGMARQPESARSISASMLIGLAFVELALLVSFVLFFLLSGKVPDYEKARVQGQQLSVSSKGPETESKANQ